MKYILIAFAVFCGFLQLNAQNNIVYGAGISYTNGAPSFTPPARTARVAIDTVTGKWYHFNTPGGWQLLGNTVEEIAGCSAPAYTPTKGDSKLVINACTNPELYFWNGSAWIWINKGASYYAGDGIRIEGDTIILDSLYTLRFRTGSALDGDAGLIQWNAQEGTLDVGINAGSVTGQMFEDVFYNCRNQTGSTITRGTVVMAAGTLGASGRILITPAIADGSVNSEYILGTAAMNIPNGSDGLVFHFGKDRGLNTTGTSCGETWADGDVLYCSASTAGCLTKVVPTAPNLKVPVAIVINAANNGTLFIRPSHFPDLAQINDVQLTSPTTGQTLIYNSVSGVWSNQTPADPSATNELQTLSVGTNTLTLSDGGGTVTVDTDPTNDVTGSGANGQVSFWTGAQTQSGDGTFLWDNANKRLSIGSSSTGDLNITKSVGNTGAVGSRMQNTNSNGEAYMYLYNDIGDALGFEAFGSNWPNVSARRTGIITSTLVNGFGFLSFSNNSNASIRFLTGTSATERLTISNAGLIGISQAAPAARLHVVGSGSTSSTWTAQFHNSATGGNNALMIRDDGNIGVRTNAPTDLIDINGANGYSQLRLRTAYTPTGTADANGNTGDVAWDADYIYIKTAAGWKRSALSTF